MLLRHRAFLQCSLDALCRGATEDFCTVFREGFETNRVLRGCFLLPGGDKGVSLKVLFCSWRFCSFFWMPCTGVCAGVFCWLLVKKLISQKTLLCVVICVNENWVALLFQDSLVLCSVKCKGWPFGTILVWRSRSWVRERARALRRCCLDSFWARARADLERSNHTTKSLRIHRCIII